MRIQVALMLALVLMGCSSLAKAQYEYQVPQQTLNQRFEQLIDPVEEPTLLEQQQLGRARRTACTTKANCCE